MKSISLIIKKTEFFSYGEFANKVFKFNIFLQLAQLKYDHLFSTLVVLPMTFLAVLEKAMIRTFIVFIKNS